MLCLGICLFLSLACTRNDTLYNPSGQSSYKLAVYAADTTGISPNVSQDSIQSILKTQLSIDSSQAITLFGFITGDPSKVTPKWNFGDGKDTAGTIVVHTYDTTGQFHAVFSITDEAGFSIADTLVITVISVPLSSRIVITAQPQSQVVATGQRVTFGVVASGNPTGYQWKKDGQNISGAVYASYTINAVQRSDSGGYTVVAIGNKTSVESDTAALKVLYTPVITAQPITQTKSAGTSCTLSVAAAGYPLPTYQWNKNGVAIPGATQPTFSIASVQRSDSGGYTLVVSNSQGSDTSAVAALTINYAPIITTQPLSQTIAVNQSCTFSVVTAGYPLPTNQWNKNGVAISGATQPTYSIGSVQRTDSGSYTVVVSNSHGSITSAAAALMVGYVAITAQPQSQTKAAGQSCTLSVAAAGYPLPTYLWNKNGVAISGATQATYSIASIQRSDSGGYTVVVSNSQVNVTSAVAVLTVNYAPIIITQPQSQTEVVSQSCTLSVVAAGYPMPTYQWKKNGTAISGATGNIFTVFQVQAADSGTIYTAVVTNSQGSVTSSGAFLIVNSTVTDVDRNVYHPVRIGTQIWMVENLRTTRFNDGTTIPLVTDSTAWNSLTAPGYCWFSNDSATYGITYGALYNWYAVNTSKLAPTGWHVPTDSEWEVLVNYLDGDSVAGGALKSTSTTYWKNGNDGATNSTGFSALPGGYRDSIGTFSNIHNCGYWWASSAFNATEGQCKIMRNDTASVASAGISRNFGCSVRCILNP